MLPSPLCVDLRLPRFGRCAAPSVTPTARRALPHLDDEEVWTLFDDALDVAPGDDEGTVHTFHGGEARSGDHCPESIHRRPRKVSKSHPTGAIPIPGDYL